MRSYLPTLSGGGDSTSGATCQNDLSETDAYGDDCTWYDSNAGSCGSYDSDNFEASDLCCACGGGLFDGECEDQDDGVTDYYGDSCDWYLSSPESCGTFDDSDFTADELCCACGGGRGGHDFSSSDDDCYSDFSISDEYGDDCSWYAENADSCGDYDSSTFSANVACCACGGGLG